MICELFGLKITRMIFSDLTSKSMVQVFFLFGPQNWHLQFSDLCLKITVTISWFGSQNHAIFILSIAPQKRQSEDGVGHVSRSGGLFRLEASRARVYQSGLKTGGGTTTDTIVKVKSRSSRRWMSRCDGLRRILVPLL
jgi:hypothetical protein